jgi:hypothetical protein
MMAHIYNPSYLGSRDRKFTIAVLGQPVQKVRGPYLKNNPSVVVMAASQEAYIQGSQSRTDPAKKVQIPI